MKQMLMIFAFFLLSITAFGQNTNPAFQWQGVIRDDVGNVYNKQQVQLKFSIIKGDSTSGTTEYIETHSNVTTNPYGLVNLQVGRGTVATNSPTNDLSEITWSDDIYWLKVDLDTNNSSGFIHMGFSEILMSPFKKDINDFKIISDSLKLITSSTTFSIPLTDLNNQTSNNIKAQDSLQLGENTINSLKEVEQLSSDTIFTSNATNYFGVWQSFTACKTGLLESIDIKMGMTNTSSTHDITIIIYDGEGVGTTLYNHSYQGLPPTSIPIVHQFQLTLPVNIVATKQYTIHILGFTPINFSIARNNPYTEGISSINPNTDIVFTVNSDVNNPPTIIASDGVTSINGELKVKGHDYKGHSYIAEFLDYLDNPLFQIKDDGKITFGSTSKSAEITVNGTISGQMPTQPNELATKQYVDNAIPIGGIIMWYGTTPPTGWALCNGSNGTPDLSGRFIVGYNPSNSNYDSIGDIGGAETVTLTAAQSGLRAHNHSASTTVNHGGAHSHTVKKGNGHQGGGFDIGSDTGNGWYSHNGNDGAHSHTATTTINSVSNQNALQAHENRPPFYTLAFIMRIQ